MPFELEPPEAIPAELEMTHGRLPAGSYTDDTQMMIALTESLLECGRVEPEHLAQAFLDAYESHRGYGGGTTRLFLSWVSGEPVATAASLLFDGEGSLGNGAAMRIAPVGVLFADDPSRVVAEAERSARLTHAHELGVDAALVQAAAVGAAVRGSDVLAAARAAASTSEFRHSLELADQLLTRARRGDPPAPAEVASALGNGVSGHESVPAALYAALAHEGFDDAVRFAVRCGGDTDTIAAMAGAIAGAREGAAAIPARWLDALEDGERGRSHVEGLAARLAST